MVIRTGLEVKIGDCITWGYCLYIICIVTASCFLGATAKGARCGQIQRLFFYDWEWERNE